MDDCWLVLGGWATDPHILHPIFGDNAEYADLNSIVCELVHNGLLIDSWKSKAAEILSNTYSFKKIAAWSTGTLLAYGAVPFLETKEMVCFSATPSFIRQPGFPFGTKKSILGSMIDGLRKDKEQVLRRFFTQCGMDLIPNINYTEDSLVAGLLFLEQASLLPLEKAPFRLQCFHGISDKIIPIDAGRFFCDQSGGILHEMDGEHAFFIDHAQQIRSLIIE